MLLAAPVVLYTGLVLFDAAVKCWKVGWGTRPFTFIGTSGILVYVLYAAGVAIGLGCLWWKTRDRLIGGCALLLAVMLGLYWLGFLTWSLGVLPTR